MTKTTSHRSANPMRGSYFKIYNDVLDSAAWLSLSLAGQMAYLCLARQMRDRANGLLSFTKAEAVRAGMPPGAAARGVDELLEIGFLAVTREPGALFQATLYRLTEYDAPGQPATNDWKNYQRAGGDSENRSSAQKSTCQPESRSMEQISAGATA